jgi:hypothetical protein
MVKKSLQRAKGDLSSSPQSVDPIAFSGSLNLYSKKDLTLDPFLYTAGFIMKAGLIIGP